MPENEEGKVPVAPAPPVPLDALGAPVPAEPAEGKVPVWNKKTGEKVHYWSRDASEVTGAPGSEWTLDPNLVEPPKPKDAEKKGAKKSAKKAAKKSAKPAAKKGAAKKRSR